MHLTDILIPDTFANVIFIYNRSSTYYQTALNLLAKKFNVQSNARFNIKTLAEFEKMEDTLTSAPLLSGMWLVSCEDSKVVLSNKQIDLLRRCPKVVLVVGVSRYGVFVQCRNDKRLKDFYVATMYGSSLTKDEFAYLYNTTIKAKNASRLPVKVYDYITKGYLREPETCFSILSAVKAGLSIATTSDVVRGFGVGNLSVDLEVLGFLTSTVQTERGLKQFLKRKSVNLMELCERQKPRYVLEDMKRSVKAILNVKQLLTEGVLLTGIQTEVAIEGFDDVKTKRFLKLASRIEDVPYSKIVLLMSVLEKENNWVSKDDALSFVYKWVYLYHLAKS